MKIQIIFLLLPLTTFAAEMSYDIQVLRLPNDKISLTSKCEGIKEKIAGIISLSQKLENRSDKIPDIREESAGMCSADITNIIPKRILELHDRTTAYPGANCWNTSLYTNKIVQSRRATAESEMTYWMNSPLCRELKANEPEIPGDIIAVRSAGEDYILEMHGFVYLTKDFSFSKSGFDIQFPYEFVSSEYVYQTFALGDYGDYKANPECRKVEGRPDTSKCPVFANIYRCMSYDQYLGSTNFKNKNSYLKIDQKLLALEKEVSDAAAISRNFTKEKGIELNTEISAIEKEYKQYIESHDIDSPLWDSIKYRLISFHIQIDILIDEIP
jgi:hypothetical protein